MAGPEAGRETGPETGKGAGTGPGTTDGLRADIDRGLTGDKTPGSDPAAAPLGTDAEAAGAPPDRREIDLELRSRTVLPHPESGARGRLPLPLLVGALVLLLVLLIAFSLGR